MKYGTDNDTFCCTEEEVNECQTEDRLQYVFRLGVELFYEQALFVLKENKKVCEKKAPDSVLRAGAVLAIDDMIENIERIKDFLLDRYEEPSNTPTK